MADKKPMPAPKPMAPAPKPMAPAPKPPAPAPKNDQSMDKASKAPAAPPVKKGDKYC